MLIIINHPANSSNTSTALQEPWYLKSSLDWKFFWKKEWKMDSCAFLHSCAFFSSLFFSDQKKIDFNQFCQNVQYFQEKTPFMREDTPKTPKWHNCENQKKTWHFLYILNYHFYPCSRPIEKLGHHPPGMGKTGFTQKITNDLGVVGSLNGALLLALYCGRLNEEG